MHREPKRQRRRSDAVVASNHRYLAFREATRLSIDLGNAAKNGPTTAAGVLLDLVERVGQSRGQ